MHILRHHIFAISKFRLLFLIFLIVSVDECFSCFINEGISRCHNSCGSCAKNSNCDDPNACTSCKGGEFKIAEHAESNTFQCSSNCTSGTKFEESNSPKTQDKEYFRCVIPEGSYRAIKFNKNNEHNGFNLFSEKSIIIISCSAMAITFIGVFGCFAYHLLKRIYIKTSSFTDTNIERGLINPLENRAALNQKHPITIPKSCYSDLEIIPAENKHLIKEKAITTSKIYSNLELIDDASEFKKNDWIGGGNYSRVYEGTLRDEPVAIKVALKEGRKSIHKELRIYDKLSHPNILKPLGIHLALDNVLFMPLRKYNLVDYFADYSDDLDVSHLTNFSIEIADGLKYLHSKNIIHCDLKIDNILIQNEKNRTIEISDFGCAIDLANYTGSQFNGTTTHMAYELLKTHLEPNYKGRASEASDVWAYAVTVRQIFMKKSDIPKDFRNPKDIIENYENGKKLPKPALISENFWRHVILQCFDLDPSARPTMVELYQEFANYNRK